MIIFKDMIISYLLGYKFILVNMIILLGYSYLPILHKLCTFDS